MTPQSPTIQMTTFLNVDLELRSAEDLTPLADAFRPRLYVLHLGRVGQWHRASFELRGQPRTPDAGIRRLVAAIRRLPARQRALWNRATRRDFNVGIQSAAEPHALELPIEAATIALVGKVGGRIVLTVYGSSGAIG